MKAWMKTAAVLCLAVLTGWPLAAPAQDLHTHTLPLVLPEGLASESLVRIINHSDTSGTVQVTAIDGEGGRFGPVTLALGAHRAVNITSSDWEFGNAAKGLPDGVGDGEGDWRLELATDLTIEALAYIRTPDGFLTSVHDVAPVSGGSHWVPFFNPGSNTSKVSYLRIINPGATAAEVTITGRDDAGNEASGTVSLTLRAGAARGLTAQDLEEDLAVLDYSLGAVHGLDGSLGDGEGKWRLSVSSNSAIEVMSLLYTETGHTANLSTAHDTRTLPLVRGAGFAGQESLVRIINRSDISGTVRITAFDDNGARAEPVTLTLGARRAVNITSRKLEGGDTAVGLPVGIGNGSGNWRLELATDLTIEALAYIRTPDGFLTSVHDVAPVSGGSHWVPFFNPGSNTSKVSYLRIINPGATAAEVTITGRDDAGNEASGTVRLTVAAGAARTLTAQALEAGGEGLDGRLGDGSGKWRLSVSSNGAIEVMSLLSTRTGHLADLSTAPATIAGSVVRPLEPIIINSASGAWRGDERIQMDLSGTGAFPAADTLDLDPVYRGPNQMVVAAPLAWPAGGPPGQVLPSQNTDRVIVLRVLRDGSRLLEDDLRYKVEWGDDELFWFAHAGFNAGRASTLLEVVFKSIYLTSDDPLLNIEASSIRPGLLARSRRSFDVHTVAGDVQADAMLQSLFGVSVQDLLAAELYPSANSENKGENLLDPVRNFVKRAFSCVNRMSQGGADDCVDRSAEEAVDAWLKTGSEIGAMTETGSKYAPRLGVRSSGLQRLASRFLPMKFLSMVTKGVRAVSQPGSNAGSQWDFVSDENGNWVPTSSGKEHAYESLGDIYREAAADPGGSLQSAIDEYTHQYGKSLENRRDFDALAGGYNDLIGERETLESLEDVYTGRADPAEALANLPSGSGRIRSGARCEAGYRPFKLDGDSGDTTCVWSSLVDSYSVVPNCSERSRPLQGYGLIGGGPNDICIYYIETVTEVDGTCPANYRETPYHSLRRMPCVWADLGDESRFTTPKEPWYTLIEEPWFCCDTGSVEGTYVGCSCFPSEQRDRLACSDWGAREVDRCPTYEACCLVPDRVCGCGPADAVGIGNCSSYSGRYVDSCPVVASDDLRQILDSFGSGVEFRPGGESAGGSGTKVPGW